MRCTEIVDILEILRLSEMGISQRQIGASVNCGKSTVGDIQGLCRKAGLAYADAAGMTVDAIKALLYPAKKAGLESGHPDWGGSPQVA